MVVYATRTMAELLSKVVLVVMLVCVLVAISPILLTIVLLDPLFQDQR